MVDDVYQYQKNTSSQLIHKTLKLQAFFFTKIITLIQKTFLLSRKIQVVIDNNVI
jgi:hypothetical protein